MKGNISIFFALVFSLFVIAIGGIGIYEAIYTYQNAIINNIALYAICTTLAVFSLVLIIGIFVFVSNINRLEKRRNIMNKYLSSISAKYHALYVIHPKKNSYEVVTSNQRLESYLNLKHPNAKHDMHQALCEVVDENYFDLIEDFIDLDTVDVRLENAEATDTEFRTKDEKWFRISFIRVTDAKVSDDVLLAIETIHDAKLREENNRIMIEIDQMTGIYNRGAGEKKIRALIDNKERGMLLLLDCDKFKSFNDTFGHEVGDKVIKELAKALGRAINGEDDIVMRLGGDEFAAYVIGVNDKSYAHVYTEKLFNEVERIRIPEVIDMPITISVGGAFYKGDDKSFEDLYKEADDGCYRSKKRSGNTCSIHK